MIWTPSAGAIWATSMALRPIRLRRSAGAVGLSAGEWRALAAVVAGEPLWRVIHNQMDVRGLPSKGEGLQRLLIAK